MVRIQRLSGVAIHVFGRDPSILESTCRGLIQCDNNNSEENNFLFFLNSGYLQKCSGPQVASANLGEPVILSIGDNFILLCSCLFKYQILYKGEKEFTLYKGFAVYKVHREKMAYQFMLYLRNGQKYINERIYWENNQ